MATKGRQFDGPHSSSQLPGLSFFRVDSMDVTNDPRMFAGNVIMKRLGAFHLIAVCAILMGAMSCKTMMKLQQTSDMKEWEDYIRYACFLLLGFNFMINFLVTVVIVQQMYHITRLITAGANGFEIAKSYYLNPNMVSLRQFAVRLFFVGIPILFFCLADSTVVKLGSTKDQRLHALPVTIMMVITGIALHVVVNKHRHTFKERYTLAKEHEKPLMGHLRGLEEQAFAGRDI